jgi:hypothetical protein
MIYTSTVTVVTAGTPVPLSPTRISAAWVIIQNSSGNILYVGGNPNTTPARTVKPFSTNAVQVSTANSIALAPMPTASTPYDLAQIYVDASVSASTFQFLYMKP